MENLNKKSSFKTPLILFVIGLVLIFAGAFVIWFIENMGPKDMASGETVFSDLNFIGWSVVVLLSLIPISGVVLFILSACKTIVIVFKNKEHPIKSSFIAHLISFLSIVVITLIMLGMGLILPLSSNGYLTWLILCFAVILILTIMYYIFLIKFIVELVKDWIIVRKAILETRNILGNRVKKQ